jgi:hypothetical protein
MAKTKDTKKQKAKKGKATENAKSLTTQHLRGLNQAFDQVWNNWAATVFSETALEKISETKSLLIGIIALSLVDIILIFPTDTNSLAAYALWRNFTVVFALLFFSTAASFLTARILGSKTQFRRFLPAIMSTLFMSLLFITIPIALVAYAIFKSVFSSATALNLFFSIIPFYNYLVFGWSAETLAQLKGVRSVIAALVSLSLILAVNLLLPYVII